MTYLFCLCHQIQGAMLDELQHIWHTIRTVQVHITLLLTYESLVTLWVKQFPCADKVLHHTDIRASFDIEVTSIKETTHIQSWNQLIRLVLRVSGCSLTMQVKVVTLRSLQIALLEGFPMPSAIALGHIHMIHVDGHPHIRRGIGNLIIDMLVNKEVVGLCVTILDVIDTRLLDRGEIELHIVVLEVCAPLLDGTTKCLGGSAILVDTHQSRICFGTVFFVQLDDCHLGLVRTITHL